MPQSRKPANYPPSFWLLYSKISQDATIKLLTPSIRAAEKLRYQYYGFIRALESEAKALRKEGGPSNIKLASEHQHMATTLRTRQVLIYANLDDLENHSAWVEFARRDELDWAQCLSQLNDIPDVPQDSIDYTALAQGLFKNPADSIPDIFKPTPSPLPDWDAKDNLDTDEES